MKYLLTACLILSGVIAQAQNDVEKLRESCAKLGIPFKEANLAAEVAKIQANNAWEGEPNDDYVVPVLRLAVYVDEEAQKRGITKLIKSMGHWVVVCETHKAHAQTYVIHPTTKKRMTFYSYTVPQNLVPEVEGYIPTLKQLKKITNPNEREPLNWGFMIYKKATAATKKKVKERK